MLKSLELANLTCFKDAELLFSPKLNVIIGENGTGKSHLLKVPYCVAAASWEEGRKADSTPPGKTALQTKLADKLVAVLRPEALGRLARRQVGVSKCKIHCRFDDPRLDLDFHFTSKSKSEVVIGKRPAAWLDKAPVFLPTRELLTIYPNFVSVYENHYLEFEETWRDACVLLGAPAVRGPREARVKKLLEPLEEAMSGKIVLDKNGRFYLTTEQGQMEMPLVAEGLRKLAMLARLIATGSLLDKGCLFWDEPESNLNPRLIKQVAATILHLCKNGIQVFMATHSLFLMRELDVLMRKPDFQTIPARFIGLERGDEGVMIHQGDSIDAVGEIAALQEELNQSDRYLEAETRDNAVPH